MHACLYICLSARDVHLKFVKTVHWQFNFRAKKLETFCFANRKYNRGFIVP